MRPRDTLFYVAPTAYEESPVILTSAVDLDTLLVPPTDEPEFKVPQAGMTFYENDADARGPDENLTRASEIDRAVSALIRDMSQAMNANPDFLNLGQDVLAFQTDWSAWRKDHLSFFKMVGTEDDLLRFSAGFNRLRDRFQTITSKASTAPHLDDTPSPPFGGIAGGAMQGIQKTLLVGGAVMALYFFGPPLAKTLNRLIK
jgi:hypothetical protein